MSLDLELKTDKKTIRHRGTGVWVREDGATRELKTMDEVKAHFPDADLSGVKAYEYEDDTVISFNLTHNLTDMAHHVPIKGTEGTLTLPKDYERDDPYFQGKPLTAYNLLWHPETNPLLANEVLHLKDEDGYEWDRQITRLSLEFVRQLLTVYCYIGSHRQELEKFNPENGWGNYDQLLNATRKLLLAILDLDMSELSDYYIYCDV